jgi:hypothetical protein
LICLAFLLQFQTRFSFGRSERQIRSIPDEETRKQSSQMKTRTNSHNPIQLTKTIPSVRNLNRSPLRRGFLSTALLSALMGVMALPSARANFIDVTSVAGLHVTGETFASPIWGDFNRDGYLDVFVDNRHKGPPYVYQNNGNGTFTDVFSTSGINLIGDRQGSAWVDFDNDGDLDLSFIKGASNNHTLGIKKDELYANFRTGSFRNMATQAGVTNTWGRGRGVAWADYDNDGFVDLIVGNFMTDLVLYRNNGNKTFTDVTAQTGLSHLQYTNCAFADYNNDGFQDIMCVVAYPKNVQGLSDILLQNNGDGTFTDISSKAGIAPLLKGQCIAWGDYDNDGDLDLFVSRGTENDPVKQTLYRNNGDGGFTDVGDEARVGSTRNNRAAAWGDYDNDGYLDLYVVNSGGDPAGKGPNNLYRNNHDGTFTDVARVEGVDDLIASRGRGATWADYDNDGFLDLFIANDEDQTQFPEGPQVLYHNQGNANHWLKIKLVGTVSNRQGLGVKVTVQTDGTTQLREANGASGHFFSQSASPLHFGLGNATIIDEIRVTWPSGVNQVLDQTGVNQEITITEMP